MPNLTPEQEARETIDKMLRASGWAIQNKTEIDFTAGEGQAVREFQTDTGPADYVLFVDGNGSIHLVGRGGVVPNDAEVAYPDTMIRLPLDLVALEADFFSLMWNSEQFRRQLEKSARTTAGIYKINQSLICSYIFPLCSLPEQQEIVRLLDEQFEVIEQNEREIDAALKRSEALRQSILKKAFTGHLVPQNPTDEPASALLERIQKEREALATKAPKKKNPRKKAAKKKSVARTKANDA